MNVRVLKINEELFVGVAKSVALPGISGDMVILPNHEPLVTVLRAGVVLIVDTEEKKHEITVEHGYVEVTPEQVTVIL